MEFNSWLYLPCFLGGAVLLYYIFPKKYRWIGLLISSLIFYLLNSRKLILFLLTTIITVFIGAQFIDGLNMQFSTQKKGLDKEARNILKQQIERKKRWIQYSVVILNFGILFLLKYSAFAGRNINHILFHFGAQIPLHSFFLPLGISFYTLQGIGYLLDVSRGKYHADQNLARFALFMCFFPQIVEGPIARYDDVGEQIYEGHTFSPKHFCYGMQLILWGLFKKIVIADRANKFVSAVFSNWRQYDGLYVILAAVLYTIQIYAEFSGCMDIVRGSAQLFGINLTKNFNQPFASKSVNEFWQRWHITLGTWLRDYVFYGISFAKPFQKWSKKVKKCFPGHFGKWIPTTIALFAVWFGMGLWHGASWKYVFYGMYYFALISLSSLLKPLFPKAFSIMHIKKECLPWQTFAKARTTILVIIGMLIFRANSFKAGLHMLAASCKNFSLRPLLNYDIIKLGGGGKDYLILFIGFIIMFVVGTLKERKVEIREKISAWPLPIRWSFYYAALFAVIILGAYGSGYCSADFIYAQF